MKFVSSEIWKFVQAVATENILTIHELLDKDNLDLEQEFYITEIDSEEDEDSEEESISYEVNLKFVDSLIIDFLENIQGSSYTPLSLTCWRGNVDLVRLLVESGADVNYIPDAPCFSFPIQVASYIANKEIAAYLIAQGADINVTNAYGNSALERAVSNNYTDLALLLLENGADPTIATSDGWMSSWNSIHQAIWNGSIPSLR
jgi:ankyrin repeat protein